MVREAVMSLLFVQIFMFLYTMLVCYQTMNLIYHWFVLVGAFAMIRYMCEFDASSEIYTRE